MRMEELLWRAGKYGEDPTEAFLEWLQRQFPGHMAERIREFQEFRMGRAESLLTYYNRLINVAEDVTCADNSLLISKFLGGLDDALGGGLRMRVYELGAEAALEEVFELAEKVELAQRKYEAYLPRPTERSRRPTWAAAMIPEERGRADTRAEMRADTRTCHWCWQVGHLRKDCKNCGGCGKPGHRKRECPDAARCEIYGKKGHDAKECYQREGGVRRNPEEMQRKISKLQSQLQAMGPRWEAEVGMYARDDEGEEVEPDAQLGAGAMEVEGKQVKKAIIDTGAQSVMLGKGMAERLGLMAPERQVAKGMLVMTAEGGEPKWMPCTRTPIELTLLPGGEHETRIRIKCGISESEDFDVLVGAEMVFAVGMSICTWTEKVEFRTSAREASERQQTGRQVGTEEIRGGPRMKLMDAPGKQSDWQQPIRLVELFGGIGTGLAAAVKNGIAVQQWIYVEQAPEVRKMAEHHAWRLQAKFPELLSAEVIRDAMGSTLHDVSQVTEAQVASWGQVDLLVAGWECQGVSWAGKRKGGEDLRTKLIESLFRILEWLQERQRRVAYLLENSDLEGDCREPIRLVRERISRQLGKGISCDVARVGSYAHRLRMYRPSVETARRGGGGEEINGEKDAGHLGTRVDFCTSVPEWLQQALPLQPGPGLVYDQRQGRWEEPTALERELAMGYGENVTAAPGVSEEERRRALGNAMDGYMMRWLVQKMWRETVLSWGHEAEGGAAAPVPQGAWTCKEEERKQWMVGEAMSEEGREAMRELLDKHRKCFAFTLQELGRCKVKEMELKLNSTEPVFHRRRKMPHGDEKVCKEKVKELLEAGQIRRSESEYATPTVVAARKDMTGEILSRRMCGDYRALNKITIADRYPMPMAEEIFDKLADGVFFTTLDLWQGFNQIKIREEDIKKMAFHGPDGLYEWLYMPFGLRNASAVFQRVMDAVLQDVECAACYIDDVVIFSTTEQQHLQDVGKTLAALEAAGLTCHPKKCRWGEQTVQYLGYEVKGGQIGIQQAKVEVLDRLREPKDKSGLRAVLGFLSYYRRFVPNFSKQAAALNGLLREDRVWEWGEAQEGALQDLMTAVKRATVLQLPAADQLFTLYTDWSSQGMGGYCVKR
ncbi:unnamed protein product [Closterium sp. NIES-53]